MSAHALKFSMFVLKTSLPERESVICFQAARGTSFVSIPAVQSRSKPFPCFLRTAASRPLSKESMK